MQTDAASVVVPTHASGMVTCLDPLLLRAKRETVETSSKATPVGTIIKSLVDESANKRAQASILFDFYQHDSEKTATCTPQHAVESTSLSAVVKVNRAFQSAHVPIVLWGSTAKAWASQCSTVDEGTMIDLLAPFDHVADTTHLLSLIVKS